MEEETKQKLALESRFREWEQAEQKKKVFLCGLSYDKDDYSPDGPEDDLKDMLQCAYGSVVSVKMEKVTAPQGECLAGTAEVAFATLEGAQRCLEASTEKYLYMGNRQIHAKAATA